MESYVNRIRGGQGTMGGYPAVWTNGSITMGCFRPPKPSLIINIIKKESFKPYLKSREGVCPLNPYWQLVLQRGA